MGRAVGFAALGFLVELPGQRRSDTLRYRLVGIMWGGHETTRADPDPPPRSRNLRPQAHIDEA